MFALQTRALHLLLASSTGRCSMQAPFLQGVLCLLCKLTRRTYYSQRPPDVARCDFPASGPDESGCV